MTREEKKYERYASLVRRAGADHSGGGEGGEEEESVVGGPVVGEAGRV